ncbi:MAG: CAAD domain-containing protein, partial [Cyanobacteria bacterium P01_F01_bin.4]
QASLDQAKKIASQVFGQLGDAPDYLVDTFNEYKRPITVIGLVLGALVAVKMTFAILSAINDIPVLAPTFELIGLIYTGWFIYRYLYKADNRKELLGSLSATKDQIIGRNS